MFYSWHGGVGVGGFLNPDIFTFHCGSARESLLSWQTLTRCDSVSACLPTLMRMHDATAGRKERPERQGERVAS